MLELEDIADVVAGAVREATGPLIERCVALEADKTALASRIAEIEARELLLPEKGDPGEPGPPGRDGRDVEDFTVTQVGRDLELAATLGDTRTVFEVELQEGPPGKDGDPGPAGEVDMDAVKSFIAEEVAVAVATLPLPEGPPGKDAAPVDMAEVKALVEAATEAALSARPAPRDGEPGKDGISVVDALIDRSGGLVHVMADGTVKALGQVVGQDGKDGIGFAEAFEDDGKFIVRMTDGSELAMPLPAVPELPDMEPPEETCELVAKALRAFAELPEPAIEIQPAPGPAKQLPIVLNVNAGGVTQAPPTLRKTITTRRDGAGNLTADIVERPDIE